MSCSWRKCCHFSFSLCVWGLSLGQKAFCKKLRKIYQDIKENSIEEEYEFMSEKDMIEAGYDKCLALLG